MRPPGLMQVPGNHAFFRLFSGWQRVVEHRTDAELAGPYCRVLGALWVGHGGSGPGLRRVGFHVLGEFEEGGAAFESWLQIQRPEVKILGAGMVTELRRVRTDVPDLIALHGTIRGPNTVDGATLAVRFRNGPPFKGRPAFVWRIVGEKGEVEVESPSGPYLHSDSYDEPIVIRVHEHGSDGVAEVPWGWETWQEELPVRARNVGEAYERFARWVELGKGEVEGGGRWPTLQDAVLRMRELDTLFQRFDKQRQCRGVSVAPSE
ncbi:hypothetical protein CTA2_9761 [Colletotrichum tanaceti]|uniref:Gal80p-like C-terminal domain-containing protein n=1 Tax=Colletotrichum tanaceti TaxID=1306861 RepID=A0A4U6X7B0_9PEZI|nr:hypothetical protein CTA2_9761 [Colletotrichum tanaceti]TKW51205.1 hypothetical protein CTA1_11836 [Colletotrichum tanaceti]